jgi:hypothetical protein
MGLTRYLAPLHPQAVVLAVAQHLQLMIMAPQAVLEVVGKLLEVGQLLQVVLEIHHLFLLRRGITAEMLHYLHRATVVEAAAVLLLQAAMEVDLLEATVAQERHLPYLDCR